MSREEQRVKNLRFRQTRRGREANRVNSRLFVARKLGHAHCVEYPDPPAGSRCQFCGNLRRLYLDHDHTTGVFRGYLCFSCNTAFGKLGDTVEKLIRAVDYLQGASVRLEELRERGLLHRWRGKRGRTQSS